MTRILRRLLRAVQPEWSHETVHFHTDGGRPYPCYDRDCLSPRYEGGA